MGHPFLLNVPKPFEKLISGIEDYAKSTHIVQISIHIHDNSKVGQVVTSANDLLSIFTDNCAFIRGPSIRFDIPVNTLTI